MLIPSDVDYLVVFLSYHTICQCLHLFFLLFNSVLLVIFNAVKRLENKFLFWLTVLYSSYCIYSCFSFFFPLALIRTCNLSCSTKKTTTAKHKQTHLSWRLSHVWTLSYSFTKCWTWRLLPYTHMENEACVNELFL